MSIFFLFIDGIGIADADLGHNPAADLSLQNLFPEMLYRRLLSCSGPVHLCDRSAASLDACLEVPGFPQSATGQVTLFTGINAALAQGRHEGGYPNRALRELLKRESLFVRLRHANIPCDFLNAYSAGYWQKRKGHPGRHSATTVMTMAAGIKTHTFDDIDRQKALYHDLRSENISARTITPGHAGHIAAGLIPVGGLALFEYFLTDLAGHGKDNAGVSSRLLDLDSFLRGLFEKLDPLRHTVLVTSDHGNVEDSSIAGHTMNPVPLIIWGRGHIRLVSEIRKLSDVTPVLIEFLADPES